VSGPRRCCAVCVQAGPLPFTCTHRTGAFTVTASDEAITMATVAAQAALSQLAEDGVVIDVSGQLVITDCFVIASASNERQVNAIVEEEEEKSRLARSHLR